MKPKTADKGYLLPDVINPTSSKCVLINVPDNPRHFFAFWGALQMLQYASNWEGTESEQRAVAEVWAEVIRSARQNWESGECIMPAEFRVVGGQVEYRPYNGTGWQNLGEVCPCPPATNQVTYNYESGVPPEDIACAIATGLMDWIFSKYGDELNAIEASVDTAAALDAIFALFLPAYLVADQITDVVNEVIEAGVNAARAWLSTEKKEEMQQYLYCEHLVNMEPPEVTLEVWEDFKQWVTDEWSPDLGADAFKAYLDQFDFTAITDRARIASYGSGNCAGFNCAGWEYTWDFLTESHSDFWSVDYLNAEWVDGVGWRGLTTSQGGSQYGKYVELVTDLFEAADITEIEMVWDAAWAGGVADGRNVRTWNGSWVTTSFPATANPVVEVNRIAQRLKVVWGADNQTLEQMNNSTIVLKSVTVRGLGFNPFEV